MSSYINDLPQAGKFGTDWHAITWDRLSWLYGPDLASLIQDGRDPKTQADLARWNSLGRRDAA